MSYAHGQDWEQAGWGHKRTQGKQNTAASLNKAKREGNVVTEARLAGGTNKSSHTNLNKNMRKLEEDTENFKPRTVDRSLSQSLIKARTEKKMTQKTLATAINEKPQVIAEYESGKAIPNGQIISKMERALGVKLPRGAPKKKTTQ
uniref:Uncharacterized protein AlNc14C1772G13061 n=1 Tax=Albugo laibachii Nc14 TaxID=890382 RepID=F0X2T9_9STRA|nr:conserved hypothetical protein [Albugo laibachii Nc14]|eukprot:CCA28249.1 conserved hypothetical protein [Albugo laibachii Nc14]